MEWSIKWLFSLHQIVGHEKISVTDEEVKSFAWTVCVAAATFFSAVAAEIAIHSIAWIFDGDFPLPAILFGLSVVKICQMVINELFVRRLQWDEFIVFGIVYYRLVFPRLQRRIVYFISPFAGVISN